MLGGRSTKFLARPLLVLKKHTQLWLSSVGEKAKNKALLKKTHIEKDEDTKAQRGKGTLRVKEQFFWEGEKLHFFQRTEEREKQRSHHFFLHRVCESRIKRVLSARSFEEEREVRERSSFSSRKKKIFFSRARGWVFCARERERDFVLSW